MLTIRSEQMEHFRRVAVADFRKRLAEHIAILWREGRGQELAAQDVQEIMEFSLQLAAKGQLKRECDIARLVEVVSRTHSIEKVGECKPALNILYAYGVEPVEKLAAFDEICRKLDV